MATEAGRSRGARAGLAAVVAWLAFAHGAPAFPQPAPSAAGAPQETGIASVYSSELEGQLTASGQPYSGEQLTAAHRTLPLGTRVRVTDPASGRSVTVVVNDRWGGGPGRVVNLSRRAAEDLGIGTNGQLTVTLAVEELGAGRVEATEQLPVVPRQRLPERIEVTGTDAASRRRQCENEAQILGLRDAYYDNHVRTCLARRPKASP
ncbi:MAG: septal ring lytic transglycosylase RlpA family protein [Burkholderiales bacterium]|nr:septal ring lytic transglycosylase RlpA family protein [Burkholderiales bacterium]